MFINQDIDFERIALQSYDGRIRTYKELEEKAICLKGILGDRKSTFFILADKSIEAISMYYYCLANRDVPFVMDEKTDKEFVERLLNDYKFHYIFCRKEKLNLFTGFSDGRIIYSDGEYVVIKTIFSYYEINPDLAVLMSTSGSTGSSKSVRITYENLVVACKGTSDFYNSNEKDIGFVTLPICYCFGQVFILVHFLNGAKLCVSDYSVFDEEFWDFFNKSEPTNIYLVPYTATQIKRLGFFDEDHSSLSYMVIAGGKSDIDVEKAFLASPLKEHCQLYLGYGQTEAVMISSMNPKYVGKKTGSSGEGLPGIKISIKNNAPVGEIVVKGKNVCLGYATSWSDLNLGDENHGILYTGDLGQIDDDGCVYILGRESRFSKISGIRYSHDEIENILKFKFQDIDVACVGNDSIIMVICSGSVPLLANMKDELCKAIHIDKHCVHFEIVDQLPLLTNGKIDYKAIKKVYL